VSDLTSAFVIATKYLWSSSQSGRPLRNINISNDNGSFPSREPGVCLRPVSCVPYVTSVFGLSILDCPLGFL